MSLIKMFRANYTPVKSFAAEDTTKDKYFNNSAANVNSVIGGKKVKLFELKNKQGMSAYVTNYGARLVSLFIADKNGKMIDIVQGFSNGKDYQNLSGNHFGAPIDSFENRVSKGEFIPDNWTYTLYINDGINTLHGEKKELHNVVWEVISIDQATVEFILLSKDMEEGFQENLKIKVVYSLTEDNSLKISYDASTDKTKIINLTNLPFFNLNGENSGNILNHRVQIKADYFIPITSTFSPTGQIKKVTGTPFDFRRGFTIGSRINDHSEQLQNGKGYFHNYVLNKHSKNSPVAKVSGDESGIVMEVFTDQPGLQFNSGNIAHGKNTMKLGYKDAYRIAFVMGAQNFPDSFVQPKFPSTALKAGQRYYCITRYRFKVI